MATSRPTLTLSADQSEVKAGGTILLTAVLTHSEPEAAEYNLSIRGVDDGWVTFYPATLNVPPGGQATATVLVAPPINAAASDLALTVRAVGTGPSAEAEATFSVRLVSTTGGPTGKTRKKQRLTWPRLLLLGAGVVLIAAVVGTFLLLHRHGSPAPARTADCTTQPTQVVDLYSDDTTTAIRISDPELTDVRILRTEPADTLSPLFSSLLSLSPDGTRLAYVTAGNEALDDAHLWSISVANPAQRQELATIPHGLWQVRPAWSQDNQQVAFLRLNDQQAAASQTQLELWVATVGGQPRKVAAPTELRPDGFYGSGAQSLCWAQDNQSVIFPSVAGNTPPDAQGSRATGSAQPAIDAGVPHQVAVNVQTGASEDLAFPLTATDTAPTIAATPAGGANCGLPVFSQNDPAWRNIIMQTSGDTIGKFGCAVTATAMLLNYYGSVVTPAQLNTCLGDKADLIDWAGVVPCANGAVTASNSFDFAWPSLDQVLAGGNPAIVGMVRGQTGLHFVVVVAGGGGDAPSYSVIDPWDGTTTKTLQTFLDAGYNLRWIRTYTGTDKACPRLVAPQTPAADATGLAPVPDGPLLAPAQLLPLFTKVSDKTGVPRELLLALARIESGFTPKAMGPLIDRFSGTEDAHALGMMQFLPSTYRTYSQQVDAARQANPSSAGTYHTLSLEAQAPAVTPLGDAGIWDPEASIWAAAFFLQQHNVATDQRGALFAYNNSDTYVDTVLKAAQQFKASTIPDANMYDPNGASKPGTLAAPNPLNPPPLSAAAAAAAVPPGAKPSNGSAAQGGGGKSGGASSGGGAPGAAGNSDSGAGGSAASGGGGGGQAPIRWSVLEGSISRAPVVLNFNSTDDIGQIEKLTLLTLTVPGSTASPVNESTPSRPFTPGMVITDDGVYQAVITTHAGGQTRVSRRKFTIDRTPPTLDVSVVGGGSASTDTTGTGATQTVATPAAQHAVATGAIRLKIAYADTLSGVTSVEYRIDRGDWQLYFNAVAFKGDAVIDIPGDHTISVRATDVAGNISSERTLDFTVVPDANTPVAAGPPSLRPVSSNVATTVTSVVAVTNQPTATAVAPTTAATPAVETPAVAVSPTTTTGSAAAQAATQQAGTPTALPPTVTPTVAPTRTTNGIAAASGAETTTPTVAVTPTVTETPTSTATAVVTPTVTATPVTSTPSVAAATQVSQTATPSTTVTTTVTVTTTPTSPVKITAPSCSDAAVKSIASCTAATITNTGTVDLHINDINTTGEFLLGDAGSTCTTALAPNASCDIPIIFVPTAIGKRSGTLTITDSSPDSPHTVALSGLGIGAAETSFAPPLFTCPDTLLGRSSPCSITLTNIGSANMTIADGLVVTGDFEPDPQNTNCVATLAVSAHCTIAMIFTPSVHGIRTGLLTINDTAPGSPQYIPLVGKGLSPGVEVSAGLLITPSSISCQDVIVGQSQPCLTDGATPTASAVPLTLTNSGDGELDLSSILPHDDFLKLTIPNNCRVVQPQQSCTIPLDFAPIERGTHVSGLTFNDNAPGSPQSVQVVGKGIAPVVELSAQPLVCPDTIVGQSNPCLVPGVLDNPPAPLLLTNVGDSPLNISSIVPNDPFLTTTIVAPIQVGFCPLDQPPTSACQLSIPIKFTPTERGTHVSGFTITDDAVGSPHSVQVTVKGLAPVVTLSAASLTCPPTIVGQSNACLVPPPTEGVAVPLALTNTGDAPLNVSSIVPNDPFIHVIVDPSCAVIAPSGVCTLPISFVPTERGSHVSGLTITDNAPGSPHSVQISVQGLAPVVSLNTTSLTCPDTIVGQPASSCTFISQSEPTPLALSNTGDAPLNIASIVVGDDFKVDPTQCPPQLPFASGSNTCTLHVTFAPTVRGNHVSNLVIADNAPGSPHTVQLAAKGLAPVFSLSTQAVTCPDTAVGLSTNACTPPTVTVSNTGDAPMRIDSIVPASDFTVSVAPSGTNCGASLAAGAACALQITFAPTVAGLHEGRLVFADNAPGSPHSVQMTAKGLAPVVSLSVTSLTCPPTIVGQSSMCTVAGDPPLPLVLTNTGDAPLHISGIIPNDPFLSVDVTQADVPPCPAGPVSATCQLQIPIHFTPTERGSYTSGLTITDNALGSPHALPITAQALAPIFSLDATTVTCPDTAVGSTTNACTPAMLTLTNTGDANLTISSIVPSNDFTIGAAPTGTRCDATLTVGATCTVQVTFAPTVAGTHQGALVFSDNAPGSPHTVQLTAKGLAPVVMLNATALTCPDTIVGAAPAICTPTPLTLTNTGDAPLTISSIAQGTGFSVAPTGAGCGATIAPNGVCSLQVTFVPTARGTYTDSLTISDNALGSPHSVQLTGKAFAPVVSLSATALTCADTNAGTPGVVVGTSSSCGSPSTPTVTPLTLTNSGDAPLHIASIVAGDDFKVDPAQCPATLPATSGSNSCTLQVSFAPTTGGNHTGNLMIADDAPGSPHTVQLTAMGLAPVATLSTQSVACSGTPLGTTIACPVFTVKDSGTSPLTISTVVLNGDFTGGLDSSCGTTLQPNMTCNVTVTFGPTAAGSRVGSLAITDNAPGSPHVVALSGTGQAPVVSLSASAIACPDTAVGATGTCGATPITMTNTGDTALAISSIVTSDDFKVASTNCPASLAAGANCTVQVSFAPTTSGSHTGNVTIIDNAAGSPQAVQLTGTGLAPVLSSLPQAIACGGTLVGTTISCAPFTIVNTGTAALTISSIALDGNFNATTANCGSIIQPGQTPLCQVTVTFNPTAAGSRVGTVTITDNAAGSPQTIPLSGTGQAPVLSLSASTVACPDTAVGATGTCGTPSLTLTNTGDAPLTISSIVATDDFKVTAPSGGCGTTLPATTGNSCTLQVSFTPTSAGSHTGTVTITDNASGSPQTVQFTGNATAPVVSFSVPSVSCPDTEVGKTNTCATIIEMTNNGTATLTWTTISANSPFGVASNNCPTGAGLGVGAKCQITVNFTPTASGNATGFLTVADNAAGSPHTVALSGNGVQLPSVTITPSGSCPDTTVGSTSACSTRVTIANASTATGSLVMTQIAISSEFGIDGANSNCGTTVAPGASCMLAITFTPLLDGQRSGTLTITDNAPNSPQSVAVSGKGLGAPQIALSPTTVACPDTLVGTTASCPTHVTLSNPGSAPLTITQIAVSGEFGLDTGTSNCGATVATGTTCTLAVSFMPTATGARPAGTMQITDNAAASPQSVTLTGNGIQPGLTIGPPTTMTCADTIVNTTATCSLGITNSGSAALTLNLSVTPGSDYSLHTGGANACGTSLSSTSGSNTCTLFVDFKPTATGTRTGTLNLGDNAPGGPHTVPLTGNGTQPAVTLSTTSITCADTAINTTGTCGQVTVRDSGTAALTLGVPATAAPFGVDSARTTCASTLAVGATCTIAINFTPGTTTGSRTGTLSITDNATDSPQSVSLSGNGVATTPALSVPTSTTSCPSTAVSSTGTCTIVTLSNSSATTAITLNLPFTAAGDFSVALTTCGSTLAASASCTLTMNFTPTATGTREGTATITYVLGTGSQQTAIITYKGTGT